MTAKPFFTDLFIISIIADVVKLWLWKNWDPAALQWSYFLFAKTAVVSVTLT